MTLESPSGVETMWHKDSIFGAQVPPLAPVDDAAEDATADGPAGEDRAQ